MDWKKTFNRGQWFIHTIFVVSIIIAIGSTLYALRLNQLQSTEEERGLKVNSLVQDLRKSQSFENIAKYLSWAESDKANDEIRELSRRIAETEELLEVKASEDLGLAMRTFNKLINTTSGMSNPTDALKVFKSKIDGLIDVAKSQGYKNIDTIAEKMSERVGQLNAKNVGESPLVNFLKSDLARLTQLVGNSALNEGEKVALNNRFESMKNEMELLISVNSQSKDLKAHVNQSTLALAQWVLDIEKKTGDLQGMRMEKQRKLVLILAGLVGFMVVAWISMAYLFRWQKSRISEQVEAEVKNVIQNGVIGDQRFMVDHYSENTRTDIVGLLDDLKIKLNLGSMLHEGLPFAGCMIDKKFKMTWFNQLFLEQLYLSEEEVRSDAFNWDYVRDYLNLDEDPIYQALVNKIAGIFPVKVKQDELTPAQPYEMYVTPITVNREDRVMVFFYPLVSMKEAIDEQVELIRHSLTKFSSLWNEERMNEDELRLLERDFKNNDIMDLYNEMASIFKRVNGEKKEYISTIRSLEKETTRYAEIMAELSMLDEEKKKIIKDEVKVANELRDSFIHSVERYESLLHINRTIMQQNDDLKNEAAKMQQISMDFIKRSKETSEILTQLDSVKVDYKKLKFELLEVKAKLISLNNSLFGQLPPLDESQQRLASRYKDELARLDFNVVTLEKKLSQLDVLLGKMQAMNERTGAEQQQAAFNFQKTQRDSEMRETILEIQKSLGIEEGKIVEHFKGLHTLMKKDLKTVTDAQDLTKTNSNSTLLS